MNEPLMEEAPSPIAIRFAEYIARIPRSGSDGLHLAAQLAAHRILEGHVCVDLSEMAGHLIWTGQPAPELAAWEKELRASPVVGAPGDYRPLILDESHRLYLARYWDYEQRVAKSLTARAMAKVDVDEKLLKADLAGLFPSASGGDPDWQRIAAATAVLKQFSVISGGPGTGKTTTVVRILAALVSQAKGQPIEIALAAPTGKATARMQDVLSIAKQYIDIAPEIVTKIPEQACTLHRLLGAHPESPKMRHNHENPLVADVVVVDEASMVDLALMAKLCDALRPEARLILLGDKDQLASVEAGSVLGDICAAGGLSEKFGRLVSTITGDKIGGTPGSGNVLSDSIVLLRKNYRFKEGSGIAKVSALVNAGDSDAAADVLAGGGWEDINWKIGRVEESLDDLRLCVVAGYKPYLHAAHNARPPSDVINSFGKFRVLCAHRRGLTGVEGLNDFIESSLREAGLIQGRGTWYPGRPVMITENDYNLRLFNGDIGIALTTSPGLRVHFISTAGKLRSFAPSRLPEHIDVYASTIHKSQGSEFDDVLLILPSESTRVMTRELIYTALTRARRHVEIRGPQDVFVKAVSRRLSRSTGLRDRLAR